MKLRDYQIGAMQQLSEAFLAGIRAAILALPTGGGKTAIAGAVINQVVHQSHHSKCCLFVVHRLELAKQAIAHFESLGLAVGVIQGENTSFPKHSTADVYVCTIQSIKGQGWPPLLHPTRPVGYIFIDETHVWHTGHTELIEENLPGAKVIGLTATPMRADLGDRYQRMIVPATIKQLTADGYLVPLKIFCPKPADMATALADVAIDYRVGDYRTGDLAQKMSHKTIVGDVVTTWLDKAPDRQTIVFCCNVAHAEVLCDAFIGEGVEAATVTYRTPDDQRENNIEDFKAGRLQMLLTVDALAIGFDAPTTDCGIMARPTLSETVFIQQAGRILRIADGKTDAILLDHAGNTLKFGQPIDFEPPPLGTVPIKPGQRNQQEHKLKVCPNCEATMLPGVMTCQECGHDLPGRSAKVDAVPGELIELGAPAAEPATISETEKRSIYAQLRFIGIQYNRKPKAAAARFKDKFGYWPPFAWNTDQPEPPSSEVAGYDLHHTIRYVKRRQKIASLEQHACPTINHITAINEVK